MGTCSGYLNFMIKRRNVAQPIRKIVKGFGMLPNKVLQNLGITGIFKKARVGTAVPCLPSMFELFSISIFLKKRKETLWQLLTLLTISSLWR